jgi:NAD+ kinase
MVSDLSAPEHILVIPNAELPKAVALAEEISQYLALKHIDHRICSYQFEHLMQEPDLEGWDMVMTVGGDGTLLRVGHLCVPLGLPLLGIQAGRLGFLSELNETTWQEGLEQLLVGQYHLEERLTLCAELVREGIPTQKWDVINEVAVSRGHIVRPIEIRVDLNEGYMTSYIADGLIISTATGSTAYALAVGGPILPPELRNMLVIPIAPHLSLDRAVVLAEGAEVTLHAQSDHEAVLSVDGMSPILLNPTDFVHIAANQNSLRMVRFGEPNYFYRRLAAMMQNNPILKHNNYDRID